ncbi:MAG: methyltransferase [Nitrospinales bacterium]
MEIEKELGRIMGGYQEACVLFTANNLKLFDAISDGPVTDQQVADSLELSPKGIMRLLNALTAMGFAVKTDDRYKLADAWAPFLTRNGEHCVQQWIKLSSDLMPAWMELPKFIETGKSVKSIMEMLGNDPHDMRAFIDAMHHKGLKATWMIARELPIGDYSNMLDLGGGPGTYSLEWAKLHNHLKATVFDIAPVLEVAKLYINDYDLADRVSTLAGDFHKDAIGKGYDLILMANILHMYDDEFGKALVKKVADALEPGGRIIINGFCTDESGTSPLQDTLFSLNMGLLTDSGKAHPMPEMITWLEQAGLTEIKSFRIEAMPTGVITGIKKK